MFSSNSKGFQRLTDKLLLLGLILFTLGVAAVTVRMNIFRYTNFDFGKFDLGNMTQMLWYTLQGKPLYLTDYFGTNLPRWAMSHVDPILLIFVPIFALYKHPLTLVFSQLFLVFSSAFLVFKIAKLELKSHLAAIMFGFAFLFYPAVGFLNAWSGFHGVTAVIPFFLAAFYVFEKMYYAKKFTSKGLTLFWVFLVLTMMGKEQLPLYVFFYGVYIALFRFIAPVAWPTKSSFKPWLQKFLKYSNVKLGISMMLVSFVWFYTAFFVIIPANAHYRIDGFAKFEETINLDASVIRNVENPNYFLSRYDAFGDSYSEVIIGMLTRPKDLARIVFGGDKPENLRQTLEPMAYTSLLHPATFIIAFPDFLINYSTSAGGIGTSEIFNHRISMIIPVLFISSIMALQSISRPISKISRVKQSYVVVLLAALVLVGNIHTTYAYENPVFLWLTQAVKKRIALQPVFAKKASKFDFREELELGERFKVSMLDNKDRECAQKVLRTIPDGASVTGPDYLGAHLAQRETYAIFPALHNSADYVIVDIFAQKILRILEVDISLVRDVVASVIKSDDYKLALGCGNLFVFERVGPHGKESLLPLQEKFEFEETFDLEIFQSLTVVDYKLPQTIERGEVHDVSFVYVKREEERLDDYFLFMSFVNEETGELYQVANLPSYALNQLKNWREDRYYTEDLEIALPEFLDAGTYKAFIGMTNNVRTRSIYLGDVDVN